MAWETALDRLVLQQIHLAEKGERRTAEVRQQVMDLWELAPARCSSAFHLGYCRTLLGVDLPVPDDSGSMRWYTLGRLRAHDRRGERSWIADLIKDPQALLDLLHDPLIASQSLPVVMRTLFWTGDLTQAVRAIDYLAAASQTPDQELLVDAALTDLLTRLEKRADEGVEEESTTVALKKCIELDAFHRLPTDVQARYFRELGNRMLTASAFDEVLDLTAKARELCLGQPKLRSSVDALAALATLRLHAVDELEPCPDRKERDAALEFLSHATNENEDPSPDAMFLRALLAFEVGDFPVAAHLLEQCIPGLRRYRGKDQILIDRSWFFFAAAMLAMDDTKQISKALRLMDQALGTVTPDLESFYPVHEALKKHDRKLALRFLDAVDVGRGSSPDQLLFVALEYISLGEADAAIGAAQRVLEITVDLDQRIEALRTVLTAHNMRGSREDGRAVFDEIRELLLQRGAFEDLETLLKNEEFVGQALDHLEIKLELSALYDEMDERGYQQAQLQTAIARSLRARRDVESLRQAVALLREVSIKFPDLAREDLDALQQLLELENASAVDDGDGPAAVKLATESLGHAPRVLVVGGNERQRRHHPRLEELAADWGFDAEWLLTNYTSPQKTVRAVADRMDRGIDLLVLLHWNRHETTEPALELARKAGVPARTLHYAGFTSLQVGLVDMLTQIGDRPAAEKTETGKRSRSKAKSSR